MYTNINYTRFTAINMAAANRAYFISQDFGLLKFVVEKIDCL